ncbi:MAG: hypothetical protein Q4E75_04175 [bacterium]|nr:hypothetical protein [bacterium]
MKKNKVKLIIILVIILIVLSLSFLIYKNIFASSSSNRYKGIENHKITNNEINKCKDNFKDIEQIKSINVYTNSKIIKIVIELKEDVDFDTIKDISNNSINSFKEKNLKFYDVEIFITSKTKESEIYPKIGYKFKTQEEFSWSK